jgi:hypothetical protein
VRVVSSSNLSIMLMWYDLRPSADSTADVDDDDMLTF